jgi:hypothetical protein
MDQAVLSYRPRPRPTARRALTLAESVELRRLYEELPAACEAAEAAYAVGAFSGTKLQRFKLLDERVSYLSARIDGILNG